MRGLAWKSFVCLARRGKQVLVFVSARALTGPGPLVCAAPQRHKPGRTRDMVGVGQPGGGAGMGVGQPGKLPVPSAITEVEFGQSPIPAVI